MYSWWKDWQFCVSGTAHRLEGMMSYTVNGCVLSEEIIESFLLSLLHPQELISLSEAVFKDGVRKTIAQTTRWGIQVPVNERRIFF